MKKQKFDVVGLGQCCVDFVCPIDSFPVPDQKIETSPVNLFGGGPVATALVALSRLGMKAAICGVTGDDYFAEFIREGLSGEKIDCSGLIKRPSSTSQSAFIMADAMTSQRTILWNCGSSFPIKPEEVRLDLIEQTKFLHLDGLHFEASLFAAKFARNRGVETMLDTGTYRSGVEELLPFIDYFIAGEGFARHFASNLKAALSKIASLGPKVVGVTLGKNGSLLLHNNFYYYQPAFKVNAVDTTGCGDAFHGGSIYAILNDYSPQEFLRFASAVAALKSRSPGGRSGLPNLAEVQEFLGQDQSVWPSLDY